MTIYDAQPNEMPASTKHPPLPSAKRVGTFGMFLFLVSLTMLFAATMLGYVIIRMQWMNADAGPNPPLGQIKLPSILWLSTFVILVSSAFLHYAGMCISLERQGPFRKAMAVTTVLALGFLIIQVPALYMLLDGQSPVRQANPFLYNLIVFMVIVHGLHVVGGIIPLVRITRRAFDGAYDHEKYYPVVHMAMYWHFLDAVWVVMFSVMMFIG